MKAPARYIQSLRIVNAQRLLERTKYSIGEVSEIVGYDNPLYFSRVFKKETGQAFNAYVSEQRIRRAKQLLQTKDRIIDIAGNVGFENSKYFSQVFKKRTGMTPQEYRAAMQKEAEL